MSRVIVIGAGIAGLATAALLADEGHDVTVLERRDEIGGRVGVWRQDGFTFDLGPSWYLMPEVFERFFARLGTSADAELDLRALPTAFRAFFEDGSRPLDVTDDVRQTIASFEEREAGAGDRLASYLASASSAYRTAVDRFLYRDFARRRDLVAMLRGLGPRDLARLARMATTSLWDRAAGTVSDDGLRKVLAYPAVFLGASPYQAPALYHLMSHLDLVEGVRYPMGGFATITTGVEVERVLVTEAAGRGRARGVVRGVAVRGTSGELREVPADVVVAAGDLHHAETRLVPARYRTYPESWWQRRDPGPGAVLVCLGVRGSLDQLAHHSLFFAGDWKANFEAVFGPNAGVPDPASIYVCRPSATDPGVAPEGHENLFVLVPVPADVSLTPDDPRVRALVDRVVLQIERWADVPSLHERIVLRRVLTPSWFASELHSWSGGALGPGHTLRQSAMFRARNASAHVDGLYYAGGSTIPGVGLPMCLISAELAAGRVAPFGPGAPDVRRARAAAGAAGGVVTSDVVTSDVVTSDVVTSDAVTSDAVTRAASRAGTS